MSLGNGKSGLSVKAVRHASTVNIDGGAKNAKYRAYGHRLAAQFRKLTTSPDSAHKKEARLVIRPFLRYSVENAVANQTMLLEAKKLCGGCWTPGGWEPPASIASGVSGHWQSEACGFMTGTQGWVKYRLIRDSD